MTEGSRLKTGRWRYVLGLASIVLSVCSGAVLFLLVVVASFLTLATASSIAGIDAPGLGLLAFLAILLCLLSSLTALAGVALLRPGPRWPMAGWMVGVCVLWLASAQDVLWGPFGGEPELAPEQARGVPVEPQPPEGEPEWEAEAGRPPAGPPEAVLSSQRRDAVAIESTYCWAPEWASNCVGAAGIPLPDENDTLAVQRGQAADLVFVLRASEGEFTERNPVPTRAVAYPLRQEAKVVSTPLPGEGYLVPEGESLAL